MRKKRVLLSAMVLTVCFVGMNVFAEAETETPPVTEAAAEETTEAAAEKAAKADEPETNSLGIVMAEQWSEKYPNEVESYMKNKDNSEAYSYVEAHPEIATLYEGMGFAFDYNSARGHSYTLEDVQATTRPHALSNCLACKTADYVALLNKYGTDFYSMSFEDAVAEMEEPITCYDCHTNDPSEGPAPIRQAMINAVGDDYDSISPSTLACAQCHNEYYFEPENKSVDHPYRGLDEMNPDAILAYYNEIGFTDYQNPRTLTNQIKVQHPEFETVMGEGSAHKTMTCAQCHMEKTEDADGNAYTSHYWVSPLASESIMENTCVTCHGDADIVTAKVTATQAAVTARETEVGELLKELTDKLAEAVESGEYSEDELEEIRALNRDAQFYWDFVFVENSEGAHNSLLSRNCLDKSQELAGEAMALLK
ncbi:MAG: ammonia-forming cytochrome c nitrite reductase subunit c552 [Eubacteriales bacterium]|nr:ammonia-forming cytochrome c nitrite reductase subunit c552 [Eubacteriales bacterium]